MRTVSMAKKVLAVLALGTAVAAGPATAAASASEPDPGEYLGVWNYDQPDRGTMRNIAEIGCPADEPDCESFIPGMPAGSVVRVPQIGRIVFAKGADGEVLGRTDRGCTWRFDVRRDSLELAGDQTCENQVIGSGYTLTSWTVRVDGRRETEAIRGISHHEKNYDFALRRGFRTKDRTEPWRKAARRFTGRWTYAPADPAKMINIVARRTTGPDGTVHFERSELRGAVDMLVRPDRTIVARTPDGCRWTLAASGNTADLTPPAQTCRRAGATVALDFWQVASDGRRQASIMSGSVRRDGATTRFLLNVGELTR
ncbi:hypothetical protein BJF79_10295 [Actinomadura sp. CNU-125]|nr:hypothetical protein BJF79_10295 [Actinomadura sp. CNU-125]